MPTERVERVTLDGAAKHLEAWRDLSARALEANVFGEPAFVLNALRHFAGSDRLQLFLVWRDAPEERLIGAMILQLPRIPLGFGVASVWKSNQAGLAALVLDRDAAEEALAAVVDWLARNRPRIIGLLLPGLDAAGATATAAGAASVRLGVTLRTFNLRRRAILSVAAKLARGFEAALPKKRVKEWARQMRRLKERGRVDYRVASDAAAIENFLALEARGWKGAQHTALGGDAGLAAFTRAMLADLAGEGRLAIPILELDGAALAIGVMLRSGDRGFYWKTAYDEAYAEYSPGVQLTLELSRAQQRDATIVATDSCAIEGHPMIERLWPGRLTLADHALATRRENARALALWLALEEARLRARAFAKRVINPLRGRRRS
jgi:CelD/BcsL family acetyltransferase involved in cellulose biosynthesis